MSAYISPIIAALDAVSRQRPLTDAEVRTLDRAMRQERCERKPRQRVRAPLWALSEDDLALRLRSFGVTCQRISERLPGRSKYAVAARLRYLDPSKAILRSQKCGERFDATVIPSSEKMEA